MKIDIAKVREFVDAGDGAERVEVDRQLLGALVEMAESAQRAAVALAGFAALVPAEGVGG